MPNYSEILKLAHVEQALQEQLAEVQRRLSALRLGTVQLPPRTTNHETGIQPEQTKEHGTPVSGRGAWVAERAPSVADGMSGECAHDKQTAGDDPQKD